MLRLIFRLFLICLAACCVLACARTTNNQLETPPLAQLQKIAVVVLAGQDIPGHAPGGEPTTEEITAGTAAVDEIIQEHFANQPRVSVYTDAQSDALLMDTQTDPARTARRIGEKTASDGVLMVHIFRFRQRVASKNQPASVAFDFRLFATGTGRALCSGRFDETQQTLTDNLFQITTWFKRGNKWLSAEQLAREGIMKMLDDCPSLTP